MSKSISTHAAKTHLSKIIEDVLAGAEVIICRGKTPVVKIIRYQPGAAPSTRPKVGTPTSAPVKYRTDAFTALSSDEDLESWGMK